MGPLRNVSVAFFLVKKVVCIKIFIIFALYSDMKGRNKDLIDKRDEALCRRYYYWTEVQRLRFDDTIVILSQNEFFISEQRIMAIIRRKCHEIKDVKILPVPKVRKPRITAKQLELFVGENY